MALVLADRVRETTTVVGTGTATLLGAVAGYQSFTAVGNANTTYYVIASQSAGEWEVGIGTYTASGTTLSRDTVLSSSNSNSLVNFSAGTKDIWVDYAAGKAVTTDTLAYPPVIGSTTPNAATFTTLTATSTATLGGDATSPALVAASNAGNTRWLNVAGSVAGGVSLNIVGAGNGDLFLTPRGTGGVSLSTAASATNLQFRAAHTASAVNYVQVTGAATGGAPVISAQGSDSNVEMRYNGKGTSGHLFYNGNGYAQFRVLGSASALNYATVAGSVSGNAVPFSVAGSDTNIAAVFQSKGTGAIDLAAGSSGVNISNGGTVTAITGTAGGSYTTIPTVTLSAPTTAGGVQATATVAMASLTVTLAGGGTGYTVNDVLTFVGGTASVPINVTVTAVSAGVITTFTVNNGGTYTALPTNPISVTGGTGTGATFNVPTWQVRLTAYTITNAGSGYVEQPTITFSSGSAAAYASVGSATVLRSLAGSGGGSNSLSIFSAGGEAVRVTDAGGALVNYWRIQGAPTNSAVQLQATGADTNVSGLLSSKGTSGFGFYTNTFAQQQFNVVHTASAVNYVQVTGAATTGLPQITAQGSDTNPGLLYITKGAGEHRFATAASTTAIQFRVRHTNSPQNYCAVIGGAAGVAPEFQVLGTDTNIDLALTPKGTGNVRFGTRTASADAAITGYIEIKDSGGTVRRLAVIG